MADSPLTKMYQPGYLVVSYIILVYIYIYKIYNNIPTLFTHDVTVFYFQRNFRKVQYSAQRFPRPGAFHKNHLQKPCKKQ